MKQEQSLSVHEPAVITIFGVTGDLARKKVLPAIYHLFKNRLLHDKTYIVGTSRQESNPHSLIADLRTTIIQRGDTVHEPTLERLEQHLSMVKLDPGVGNDYQQLKGYLDATEEQAGTCLQRFFYLSVPPQAFSTIVEQLGEYGMQYGCQHRTTTSRLLVEKPFGHDTASAESLIQQTAQHFNEEQIFRIDHYLAKETAQNILTFRTRNPLFNTIWNNQHITKVAIIASETIGIEGRVNFYDQIGALRDLVQSHLMQLLALTLMDTPETMSPQAVHAGKQAVLTKIDPVPSARVHERAVRAQYVGYREEVNNPHSNTETYASVTLFSSDHRWQNVPLVLTAGKGLAEKHTSITIDFGAGGINQLEFRIQPNEGITLTLQIKQPGLGTSIKPTSMDFDYQTAFQLLSTPDAYERVLIEAMRGDRTLFTTDKEVMTSWHILQPLLAAWQKDDNNMLLYERGSTGPTT